MNNEFIYVSLFNKTNNYNIFIYYTILYIFEHYKNNNKEKMEKKDNHIQNKFHLVLNQKEQQHRDQLTSK